MLVGLLLNQTVDWTILSVEWVASSWAVRLHCAKFGGDSLHLPYKCFQRLPPILSTSFPFYSVHLS